MIIYLVEFFIDVVITCIIIRVNASLYFVSAPADAAPNPLIYIDIYAVSVLAQPDKLIIN